MTTLEIRLGRPADRAALRRLAALDSALPPAEPTLVAFAGPEPVAALPLDGGPGVADPFRPTADVLQLLRLRRAQVAA